jgi:hypothetical protein
MDGGGRGINALFAISRKLRGLLRSNCPHLSEMVPDTLALTVFPLRYFFPKLKLLCLSVFVMFQGCILK